MQYVDQEDAFGMEEVDYDPASDPVVTDYLARQAAQREVDAAMKLAEEKEALEYMREVADAAALQEAIPCGADNDPCAIIFAGGPVEKHNHKGRGSEDIREVRGQQKHT